MWKAGDWRNWWKAGETGGRLAKLEGGYTFRLFLLPSNGPFFFILERLFFNFSKTNHWTHRGNVSDCKAIDRKRLDAKTALGIITKTEQSFGYYYQD